MSRPLLPSISASGMMAGISMTEGCRSEGAGDIVVIQRVARGAVDQCGVEDAGAPVGAVDQRRPGRGGDAGHAQQDLRAFILDTGQRDPHRVGERAGGPVQRLPRDIAELQGVDALRDLSGQGFHGGFLGGRFGEYREGGSVFGNPR